MSIAILVPVLNRPQNAHSLMASIRTSTTVDHKVTFICSPEDHDEHVAAARSGADAVLTVPWDAGPGDYAKKINWGFARTTEPWVFLGADDLRFHPGWATAALQVDAQVIGTRDGWNPSVEHGRHATHLLVWRRYIEEHGGTFDEEPGVVYCEEYDHQSVDNELIEVAKARGVWGFAEDALVEHLHPFAKKSKMDDTYRKGLAKGKQDIRLFARRRSAWLRKRRRAGSPS